MVLDLKLKKRLGCRETTSFFLLSTHPKECKIFIQEKRLISQALLGYLISIGV
jgi:hypothetical protein